ncbi:hypothetical protein BH11PLA1_BH11PLA1_10520 [soil metagenome]
MAVTRGLRENLTQKTAPRRGGCFRSSPRAFSLVDVLVSISVIAILMSLLLPSLSGIRETSRRVACSSNIRQFGLGIAMYAEDHREVVPYSDFTPLSPESVKWHPESTMTVREESRWDGLGLLFANGYTPAMGIYYCPSHMGDHPLSAYADAWISGAGTLVSNYQYRGISPAPRNATRLRLWDPNSAIVSDGLASATDYNHVIGNNTLRADASVLWTIDSGRRITGVLSKSDTDGQKSLRVIWAWNLIDTAGTVDPAVPPAD